MVDRISRDVRASRAGTWALGACVLLTFALGFFWPQAAQAGGAVAAVPSNETAEAVRWGIPIAFGLLLLLALPLRAELLKVMIGADNRVSSSKTIAAVWTFVVAVALGALVYADLLGHHHPLQVTDAGGRVGQYALLFGGPLGAAILSKAIVTKQVSETTSAKTRAESPALSDLVANDSGETDLGDLQYVLFNIVALVFVVGTILHEPANGLPHIPDVLLGLTSASAAGYVGKKLLPPQTMTAELTTAEGKATVPVTITLTGMAKPAGPQADFWVRFGADDEGGIESAPVSPAGVAAVSRTPSPVPAPAPAELPLTVDVTVITEGGAVLGAGKFKIIA